MSSTRRTFLKSAAALGGVAGAGFPHIWSKTSGLAWAAGGEIKVGVLYSLTGTTAIIETSLNQATLMAIEEINAAGGIAGMKVVPIVEDPASDPATFSQKAKKLVIGDKCVSVFGSYTSASRKAVLPVFEKYDNLYWYPTLYEGRECSKNVIYTGAVPNQQQKDFVPWLVKNFGKKFYLIGSNYIYPKEENNVCKILLQATGRRGRRRGIRAARPFGIQHRHRQVQGHEAERHLLDRGRGQRGGASPAVQSRRS